MKKIDKFENSKLHCPVCEGDTFVLNEGEIPDAGTYTCCNECGATGPIGAFVQASNEKEATRLALEAMQRAAARR